jgi:hypothetical protein
MANANTVVDALRTAGVPTDQALILTNPGGNNPWLFTNPASSTANAGAPCALEVPTTSANGVTNGLLSGTPLAAANNPWYADGNVFIVRALGRVQPNAFSKTLKLYLFAGNGLSSGAAGALGDFEVGFGSATLPALGQPAAFTNWYFEAKCLWDSSSLNLNGIFSGFIGSTNIAATNFSIYNPSAWAAQQAAGAYNNLPFVVGANLNSTANAVPDLVTLEEFTADIN